MLVSAERDEKSQILIKKHKKSKRKLSAEFNGTYGNEKIFDFARNP
jgi:hypothetical protein